MPLKVKSYQVKSTDTKLIDRLASWYYEERGIPKERTINRLTTNPNEDIIVQLVLKEGNRIIATGGLYNNTGLTIIFPKYKALSPWIAELYTDKEYRKKGYCELMVQMLEEYALGSGITQVYLCTKTSGRLFITKGYQQIERLKYRSEDTVVLEKCLIASIL